MDIRNRKIKISFALIILVLLCLYFVSAVLFLSPNNAQAITDTSAHVNVGNLLKSDLNSKPIFDKEVFALLFEKITGKTDATIDDISQIKEKNSGEIRTANGNKELIVDLGGYKWSVVYVANSKTDGTGDPILTLWLTNSGQIPEAYRNVEWNSFSDTNMGTNPSCMYGTSMMRSLALNNGGTYFSDNAGNGAVNVTPKEDHPFARFTMPRSETLKSSLIDYLEMPANVEWQGNEVDSQYTFLNDAYNIISEGFIKGQEAVQNCIGYDGWKNDYLWLPSMTEIGYTTGVRGLWNTSYGLAENENPYWVRSASLNGYSMAYTITQAGNNHVHTNVNGTPYAIRPAIHLNLSKVFNNPSEPPEKVTIEYSGNQLSVLDLSNEQKSWYAESKIDLDYLGS